MGETTLHLPTNLHLQTYISERLLEFNNLNGKISNTNFILNNEFYQ